MTRRSHPLRRLFPPLALLLVVLTVAAACGGDDDDDVSAAIAAAQAEAAAVPVVVVGAEDPQTGAPAAPLADAAAVFAAVSPALVLVTTPAGAATGVLTEGGFIVTSATAVGPHLSASVRLADGAILPDVPVLGLDRLVNIALLGPIADATTVVVLGDSDALAIGSEVFLVGFAGAGAAAHLSISAGLISARREWQPGSLSFLQSDAPVAPDQAGGALITPTGAVVGLAGPGFGAGRLNLFTSAADLLRRVALIVGSGGDTPGVRLPDPAAAATNHVVSLGPGEFQRAFVVQGEQDAELNLTLTGDADGAITALNGAGVVLGSVNASQSGVEILSLTLSGPGPYVVLTQDLLGKGATFQFAADLPLTPLDDPDDGTALIPGQAVIGALDFAGDEDSFLIELAPGQQVTVGVSSIVFDVFLTAEGSDGSSLFDDDSAGGLFGTDAQLVLQMEDGGLFTLVVSDVLAGAPGGYVVQVLGEAVGPTAQADGAMLAAVGVAPSLPAGHGLATRGVAEGDGLVARLVTIDAETGPGASQIVRDADGAFQVIATISVQESGQASISIREEDGDLVGTPTRLNVVCGVGSGCLGAVTLAVVAEGDGPWTVEIAPLDGAIVAWQLEIIRTPEEAEAVTLPAE